MVSRILGALWVLAVVVSAAQQPSLLESLLHMVMTDIPTNANQEPKDEPKLQKEYDFIIVGAGTAGCVLANRLSEVPNWRVLLIEAGGPESFPMDIPILANLLQFTNANWKYLTQPSPTACLGMENGQCHWPRGKVIGGSSVLNYMIFTRGNERDYNLWKDHGNEGWGWDDVLPYFKKMEDLTIPKYADDTEYRSTDGYMSVSNVPYRTPIADAFVKSGRQMHQPSHTDYNGATQIGFNYLQVSQKNGTRSSSSRAYLHPASRRSNLSVKKFSQVTKILIDPVTKTAIGVEFVRNKKRYTVKARKEVILSAGTIGSAQLLMLSGVGPKEHLRDKKIKVIQDSKVGYNLQDHIAPGGLTYTLKEKVSLTTDRIIGNKSALTDYFLHHNGPMSIPGGCEALAFLDLTNMTNPNGWPDLELLLISGGLGSEATLRKNFNIREDIYRATFGSLRTVDNIMVFPMLMRPKSIGRIMLQSNDPFHYPLIYPGYFSDPEGHDIKLAVKGIRESNKVLEMPAFKKLGAELHKVQLPPCKVYPFDSDQYWECHARYITFTIYHHVGTCKMGPDSDPNAVVDNHLRVRGIKNLRVIDASIMPIIPAAHTNAPTLMIAEKGADLIKQDHGNNIR